MEAKTRNSSQLEAKKAIKEVQNKAKSFIIKNEFKEAINIVNNFIQEYGLSNTTIEKHLISISSSYFDIRSRGISGTLSLEELQLTEAKLIGRFLILIDDLYEINPEKLVNKNENIGGELVFADHYINEQLSNFIKQIVISDDKINELKITIEDKKIEITKTKNTNQINNLNLEIETLKSKLDKEKDNYHALKLEYDNVKKNYDNLLKKGDIYIEDKQVDDKCKICFSDLDNETKCIECGYENDDFKMIRQQLRSITENQRKIEEKNTETMNFYEKIQLSNSMIFQYLDDLNRKISNLEKLMK